MKLQIISYIIKMCISCFYSPEFLDRKALKFFLVLQLVQGFMTALAIRLSEAKIGF